MTAVRNALIVGGGPAGLSAAITLTRAGIEVEIAELNDDIHPLGSGLSLSGATLRALRAVDEDMFQRCIQESEGHEALTFCDADGHVQGSVPLPRLAGPEFPGGFGVRRPVLWGLLAETAQQAGATIHLSTTVTSLTESGDGVEVTLTDGSTRKWDLMIGADGLHSQVRELAFPDAGEPFFTGQTVWRAIVPRPEEPGEHNAIYHGPRSKAGCNPVSATHMYLYVVENTPDNTRVPREQWPEVLDELLSDFGGMIGAARSQIVDLDLIDRRPLQAFMMPAPWHTERVLLIGDAAHATTPHLATGAGIAIEDAVVLAEELERHDTLGEALHSFMDRRYERCRLVVENSLQLGEWEKFPEAPEADPVGLARTTVTSLAIPF
jgi:2-polyprenyl-6-methoxyphenol hydroxylase-like FAD-dependent oxidoreductase